jgi:REP element-mobilizing transposase RayT
MTRPLRIEYPGAVYHVTARGNERQDIFRDEQHGEELLGILDYAIKTHGNSLYSYVLMNNHFHLSSDSDSKGRELTEIGFNTQTTFSR